MDRSGSNTFTENKHGYGYREPSAPPPKDRRPLPPEIAFNAATGIFSGTARPGVSIRLTSSADPRLQSATADSDGKWAIALRGSPRWYTIFRLWACDRATGAGSEEIQVTVGGKRPTFEDVYASRTVVFGRIKNGNEINVYGPEGDLLGRTFVLGNEGIWAVTFRKPLKAGDRICVVAKILGGDTSLPLFTSANTFSVDDRNVGHIAGSGARPGDRIQIFTSEGNLLAETDATPSGTWSISFCKALAASTRINIRRVHLDGSSSAGPVFETDVERCLAPVIDMLADSRIGGLALSGLLVECRHFRDGTLIKATDLAADENNRWESAAGFGDYQENDSFVATTRSTDNRRASLIHSAVTIGSPRPDMPGITSIDQKHATGTGQGGQYIVVSSAEHGLIHMALISNQNTWSIDWTGSVGSLPKSTVVYFIQMESINSGFYSPTSEYAARYADADAEIIEPPVILGYRDEQTFYGTEGTADVFIRMFNCSELSTEMKRGSSPVVLGKWTFQPEFVPKPGDEVYATASTKTGNSYGVTSEISNYYTVGEAPATKVPLPPEIDYILGDSVTGTAQLGTYITLTLSIEGSGPQEFPAVQSVDGNWEVPIGTVAPSGAVFSATARFGQTGDPSDAYVKVLNQNQKGFLVVDSVSETAVTGTAPQPAQVIMGWRSSDGKKIVDQALPGTETAFNIPYPDGLTLAQHDQLNLVSAFPDNGTMTPYNSKPEGYPNQE